MRPQQMILDRLPLRALQWIQSNSKDSNGNIEQVYSDLPYVSKIRFQATMATDGSGNVTYTFLKRVRQAFSYAVSDALPDIAGFEGSGLEASYADTNLTTAKQTNDGRMLVVTGIAIQCEPTAEPEMVRNLIPVMSHSCGFSDKNTNTRLGKTGFYPGAGSLFGSGPTVIQTPPLSAGSAPSQGFPANGWPVEGNHHELDDPIVWYPTTGSGGGGAETNFLFNFEQNADVVLVAKARTAASGVVGITPPSTAGALGTYVDMYVRLFGFQFGPRTTNQ